MRAQLSLEFLAYLSLAGLAMAFIAAASAHYTPRLFGSIAQVEIEDFVSEINGQITSENFYEPLQVYIPQQLCNSSLDGSVMATAYGKFSFVTNVSIDKSLLCNPGEATLSIIPDGEDVEVEQYE